LEGALKEVLEKIRTEGGGMDTIELQDIHINSPTQLLVRTTQTSPTVILQE
jgi:hypothetical protein